jgi:hypothetical protein
MQRRKKYPKSWHWTSANRVEEELSLNVPDDNRGPYKRSKQFPCSNGATIADIGKSAHAIHAIRGFELKQFSTHIESLGTCTAYQL